jgi:predicted nucleic acid-binding protein
VAVLVLDTEAVSAPAHPRQDPRCHEVVRAAMRSAHRNNAPVRIPSAALVELYRGRGTDEAVDALPSRGFAQVVTTGARMVGIAGHLLADIGAGSRSAIDALVVATAIRFGGGIVVTHDPDDLGRLAATHPNVAIFAV